MNPRGASFLQAPFLQGSTLDGLENQVLDNKADDDDRQQACEDRRYVEKVAVFEMSFFSAAPAEKVPASIMATAVIPRRNPLTTSSQITRKLMKSRLHKSTKALMYQCIKP
jgi:hypothetical protein